LIKLYAFDQVEVLTRSQTSVDKAMPAASLY